MEIPDSNFGSSLLNITEAVNQYVVAPLAAFGIGGFVFSATGEAQAKLSSDITDHYTEDNSAVQDQIALRPQHITLKGYVGELVYTGPQGGQPVQNTVAAKLISLTSFLPVITASATQIQQAVSNPGTATFSEVLGTASNIYGLVENALASFGPTKNQQNAYNFFKALWQSKTLMGVQTPWEFMTNMAIEDVAAIQPEETMWRSDFSITLKKINVAKTSTIPISNASAQSNTPAALSYPASAQQALVTQLGSVPGAPVFMKLAAGNF